MKALLLFLMMMGATGGEKPLSSNKDGSTLQISKEGGASSGSDSEEKNDEMLVSQFLNGQSKTPIFKSIVAMAQKDDWSEDECQEGKWLKITEERLLELVRKKNNSATRKRSLSICNQELPEIMEE